MLNFTTPVVTSPAAWLFTCVLLLTCVVVMQQLGLPVIWQKNTPMQVYNTHM